MREHTRREREREREKGGKEKKRAKAERERKDVRSATHTPPAKKVSVDSEGTSP